MGKNLSAVQETWVQSLGQEDPLETWVQSLRQEDPLETWVQSLGQEDHDNPVQYSCLGNSMDRAA